MKRLHGFPALVILVFFSISQDLLARPEYAARLGMSRCTACHVSPTGGGHRVLAGKAFGSKGYALSKWSQQDLISVDLRGIYNYPEKVTDPNTKSGTGIMAVNVSANVPLKEEGNEIRLLVGYDAGGFTGSSNRDVYARFRYYEDYENHWYPQYMLIGRFKAPVGLVTDEHRTYVRMQNATGWNDFSSGALFSGDPLMSLHYDWGLINGEPALGGTGFGESKATLWGSVLNIRWTPGMKPFVLGTSGTYHKRKRTENDPYSYSLYGILATDSFFNGLIKGTVMLEYQRAKFWNSKLPSRYFKSSSTYTTSVANEESQGLMAQWNWEYSEKWTFLLKFEELILDVKNYPSDWFRSHGVGVNYAFGPNMLLKTRYDYTDVSVPQEKGQGGYLDQDMFWAMMQISF